VFSAFEAPSGSHKALRLIRAVLGIAFGLLLLSHPVVTAAVMVVVLGCYAIGMGVTQIGAALLPRRLSAG